MSKKGDNIYKRKDGRWEGRYTISSGNESLKKYGYIYGRTYEEVKEKLLMEKAAHLGSQIDGHASDAADTAASPCFHQLAEEWYQFKKQQVKESTLVKYRIILDKYIYPSLENLQVTALTRHHIEELSSRLLKCGGRNGSRLSPKTVADVISVVRDILNYTSLQGYLIPHSIGNIQIRREHKNCNIFTLEEQKKLYNYTRCSHSQRDLGILLSLFAGLRVGEVCALTWEDIDLHDRYIRIYRTMQRLQTVNGPNRTAIRITSPKSISSIRTIPIPDILYEILKPLERETGYVLTGSETCFVEPRAMQYHFKRVLRKCQLNNTNYHTLRHTFATRCIEVGFDVNSLSEILGHSSASITLNRYVHPSMEMKKTNMKRLSDAFAVTTNNLPDNEH